MFLDSESDAEEERNGQKKIHCVGGWCESKTLVVYKPIDDDFRYPYNSHLTQGRDQKHFVYKLEMCT